MRRGRAEEEVWESRAPAHTQLYGASMNPCRPFKCTQVQMKSLNARHAGIQTHAYSIAFRLRTKAITDMFHKAFLHSETRLLKAFGLIQGKGSISLLPSRKIVSIMIQMRQGVNKPGCQSKWASLDMNLERRLFPVLQS